MRLHGRVFRVTDRDRFLTSFEQTDGRALPTAGNTSAVCSWMKPDALVGKRSEVKNGHDRYATSRLRFASAIEAYEGITILPTDLRQISIGCSYTAAQFAVELPGPIGGVTATAVAAVPLLTRR